MFKQTNLLVLLIAFVTPRMVPKGLSLIEQITTKSPFEVNVYSVKGQFCQGVLITYQAVVVPASCIFGLAPEDLNVYLGRRHFQEMSEVGEIRMHEDIEEGVDHNIAVLIFKQPVQYSESMEPIEIATEQPSIDITDASCQEYEDSYSSFNSKLFSCVDSTGYNSCKGSPIKPYVIYDESAEIYIFYGFFSQVPCSHRDRPIAFTFIGYFKEWLEGNIV